MTYEFGTDPMTQDVFITDLGDDESGWAAPVDPKRVTIPNHPIELPNLGRAIVHRSLDIVWATVSFDVEPPPIWEWQTRVIEPIRDAIGAR